MDGFDLEDDRIIDAGIMAAVNDSLDVLRQRRLAAGARARPRASRAGADLNKPAPSA